LDEQTSRPFIRQALDSGINFFDTADMYSVGESERVMGETPDARASRLFNELAGQFVGFVFINLLANDFATVNVHHQVQIEPSASRRAWWP